ncbi:lactoylglutathione lyase GLO1 KNAG_0C06000 [Huiozyma naganishii CBS 8797]|uniref:Lactoylglutathione lyase n=1 Tax=Huiozyma naganishii (strain ATCC MYA-139 / BCRC 22969 / CBS 8797 / KCTC 17520 / NBRC 10181 / NCYC 3082 / Yp74L-3) TaxID=1071383 RepID=J7RX98_HUIN7|nr:hypothetical protein KNAG_0C06000 [Kazachstania naganishii CBS 8797]CCK69697.1 hypothetical protein KNAG_0C06000 [Kazachstania naganishii CBS 8797]
MAGDTGYDTVVESAAVRGSVVNTHTCLRVKDPKVSLAFYEKQFGMRLLKQVDVAESRFSLYFLSFEKEFPHAENGSLKVFATQGVLELTHNWGTEDDASFKVNNGNGEENRGFGHVCFTTRDIAQACVTLEARGVSFKKRMSDGRQKDIAFVLDPDGYWIELVQYPTVGTPSGQADDLGYKFNHTMVRVKDARKSVAFYTNVLGMQLLEKSVHENAKFTLYFLGYPADSESREATGDRRAREGLLELTHNWGTEDDAEFRYHNGNDAPQGYGHICISCKDPEAFCNEVEQKYGDKIAWAPKFNQGKMKNIAFLKDPDGYSVEVTPQTLFI